MLTGYTAKDMVGTNKQWTPFWDKKCSSMADVIVDQTTDGELERLLGTKWRKSALVEGAFETELFFPKLKPNGKWCFISAAPIKRPDGTIIGAIEILRDTTEDKKADATYLTLIGDWN